MLIQKRQQINFARNINHLEGAWIAFILKEIAETIFDFLQGTVRVL